MIETEKISSISLFCDVNPLRLMSFSALIFRLFLACLINVNVCSQYRQGHRRISRQSASVQQAFDCSGILHPGNTAMERSFCMRCSTTSSARPLLTGRRIPQITSSWLKASRPPLTITSWFVRTPLLGPVRGATGFPSALSHTVSIRRRPRLSGLS